MEKLKNSHDSQMKDNEEIFKRQAELNKNSYRLSLLEQRKQYQDAFQKNMKMFEQQVANQREQLRTSLAKEKREVLEDVGKYNSKNGDPFYRVADPRAELSGTNDHYILSARIPEHEKDNVKVVVHENSVVVHGDRHFEDQVEESDNKVATHNYQTFRQEIALEHPVHEKYVQKSYDNGVLTIKIPKA